MNHDVTAPGSPDLGNDFSVDYELENELFDDIGSYNIYEIYWNVPRGTMLKMTSGGDAEQTKTGRYSLIDSVNLDINVGGRCSVFVDLQD